jgi:hypothetical protein
MGFAIGGAILAGAAISGAASSGAAGTEAGAANTANAYQYNEFEQEQANEQPWLQSGEANLATLNADMPSLTANFTDADFQQSPGYQFQLQQGEQAMQRSAAAKGLLNSVGTQQNLNNYAQGTANQDYQQALQNYMSQNQNRYNMLSGMAGMGQTAVAGINQAGQTATNAMSANTIGAANASAAGQVGVANSITSGIGQGINAYQSNNLLAQLQQNQNGFQQNGYGAPTYSQPVMGSSFQSAPIGDNFSGVSAGADPLGFYSSLDE